MVLFIIDLVYAASFPRISCVAAVAPVVALILDGERFVPPAPDKDAGFFVVLLGLECSQNFVMQLAIGRHAFAAGA